jgi:hypothetical protein
VGVVTTETPRRRSELLAQARRDSMRVVCRDCGATIGAVCVDAHGRPLEWFPAHDHRLKDAGVELPGLTDRDRGLIPATVSAGAETELRRTEALIRIRELRGNVRAGDITEAERAELARLEAAHEVRPPEPPQPRTSVDEAPGWMRGPGVRR